ncbi:MAG: WG repeat-containing protein [Clostridia bacterium]|nr:WG repeat-containing protein [Clostridia bacterium]
MKKLLTVLLLLLSLSLCASAEEPTLWPAYDETTGLWGYIDETGAWAIAPQYKQAYRFSGGCAIVGMGEDPDSRPPREGIIDATGAFLLPPEYFVHDDFAEDVFFVMDTSGDEAMMGWFYIPDRFFTGIHWYECVAYSDGPYVCVDDGEVQGLADRATGEIVLSMEYTRTGLYEGTAEDGFIVAERDDTGECELIEIDVGPVELPEGAVIDYGEGVSEGLIPFEMDGKCGYLNTAGEIVIPAQYRYAIGFNDGYAEVGLWEAADAAAIIDRAGNVVMTIIGDRWETGYYGMVGDAMWIGYSDAEWGLVRPDGMELCRFSEPESWLVWPHAPTEDGPIWVSEELGDGEYAWRLLSREDWTLSEPIGQDCLVEGAPSDPHPVEVAPGLWRYVDAYGETVIGDVTCMYALPFEGALARVAFNECAEGYINRAGEVVCSWRISDSD